MQVDISPTNRQMIAPVQHLSVNGVSAANQRLNLASGLVKSSGSRTEAQKIVDGLFGNIVSEPKNDQLPIDAVKSAKVQESFDTILKEGYPNMLGVNALDSTRVPAVESQPVKSQEAALKLIPELQQEAKIEAEVEAEDAQEKEQFGLPIYLGMFRQHQYDEIGSGKLNDAIVKKHLEDVNSQGSTSQAVDEILTDYVEKNQEVIQEQEPDVELTEMAGNWKVIDNGKEEESLWERYSLVITLIALVVVLLIGFLLIPCIKNVMVITSSDDYDL